MGNHGKWMINNMPHSPVRMILLENIYIYIPIIPPLIIHFPVPFVSTRKNLGFKDIASPLDLEPKLENYMMPKNTLEYANQNK